MRFTNEEPEFKELLQQGYRTLKATYDERRFIDAWLSEAGPAVQPENTDHIEFQLTSNGLLGRVSCPGEQDPKKFEEQVRSLYLEILNTMTLYPEYTLIRFWNYVPSILKQNSTPRQETLYTFFNSGRYRAFREFYGDPDLTSVPAESAVGSSGGDFKIEFLAVQHPIAFIENREQKPAYLYSEKYGKIPPLFSRGVIYDNQGQKLLLSSGTASIRGEDSVHHDIHEQLYQSIQNLRILGSQFNLKGYDIHYGFALEDVCMLRVYYKNDIDLPFLQRFLPKFFSQTCRISYLRADICRAELLIEMEAVFVKKGEYERNSQQKYILEDDRIRIESFEIHIAEHCNLSCKDCCNDSPFNPRRFLSLEEISKICLFVKTHFLPELFKIAGGEPTLHPQINQILTLVKKINVSPALRVTSNGILMHRMTPDFWKNIDQLTISNYISAPVKPKFVDEIKQKAKDAEVVLNIKDVREFNEIFSENRVEDDRVASIYADCWMRHRCLIIRNDRFYKCTRAAYMDDTLHRIGKDVSAGNSSFSKEDGILLDDPDFTQKALSYLNSPDPLHSCFHCLGVAGALSPNIQLNRKQNNRYKLTDGDPEY